MPDAASAAAMEAIRFCHATPSARVACVWPTGASQLDTARTFLQSQGAQIVHDASVPLADHAHVLLVMALYYGEDWLTSNCYYWESALPGGPPDVRPSNASSHCLFSALTLTAGTIGRAHSPGRAGSKSLRFGRAQTAPFPPSTCLCSTRPSAGG